jgi:hypothetical protein
MNPKSTLEMLFEEAVALARDESLDEPERGRRLVALLGMPVAEQRRVRLTHLYGPKMAADICEAAPGPYRFKPSRRPGDPAPTVREVFPS